MQQLVSVLGPEGSKYVIWVLVGIGVLIGLGVLIWLGLAVFGRSLNMSSGERRGQPQRLGITGAFTVDRKGRKLVIVRRDNVEHLILIGGPNDVLVESNIVRAQRPGARGREVENTDLILTEPAPAPTIMAAPAAAAVQPAPKPAAPPAPPVQPAPVEPTVVVRAPVAPQPAPPPRPAAPPPINPAPPVPHPARPQPAAAAPAQPVPVPVAVVSQPAPPPPVAPPPPPSPVAPPPPPVEAPVIRRAATDPMLSDMAKRLQSVLQRPSQTTPPRRPDPAAAVSAETIPIPLPSAARTAPEGPPPPVAPPRTPTAPPPPAAGPASPAKSAAPPPAPVTQGKAVPVPPQPAEASTIDSLEEEMARLLGRPGPDKA